MRSAEEQALVTARYYAERLTTKQGIAEALVWANAHLDGAPLRHFQTAARDQAAYLARCPDVLVALRA